jgi:hypothetical protein
MSPCITAIALILMLCVIYPPFAVYAVWLFVISVLFVWTTRIYNNAILFCDSSGITVSVRDRKYFFEWNRIAELYFLEGGGEILAPISLNVRMQNEEEPSVIIIDKLMFQFSKEKYQLVRTMIEAYNPKKYDLDVVLLFEE